MKSGLAILRIETRRNIGLLVLPVVVAIMVVVVLGELQYRNWFWPNVSLALRYTLILVGPLLAGLAAWTAGRDRRRGMEELLATTSRPAITRDLAAWTATMAWVTLAYVSTATVFAILLYTGDTWGPPVLWPTLIGLFALFTHAAVGYAAGCYLPSRFTAPIIAFTLYWVQGLPMILVEETAPVLLTPLAPLEASVFFGVLPNIFVPQSLWLFGLAGTALAATAVRRQPNATFAYGAMLAAAVTAAAAALMLLGTSPRVSPDEIRKALLPYEPVCAQERVTVCVHPAYEAALTQTSAVVNKVSEPLTGVQRSPTRAEQSLYFGDAVSDNALPFSLYDESGPDDQLAFEVAANLVRDAPTSQQKDGIRLDATQMVVGSWLLQRAGIEPTRLTIYAGSSKTIGPKLNTFAGKPREQQRQWLRENYAGLRAGKVTLEDLP